MKISIETPALGHLFVEAMDIEVESIIVTPYVTISSRYNSERLVMDLHVGDQAYYDILSGQPPEGVNTTQILECLATDNVAFD